MSNYPPGVNDNTINRHFGYSEEYQDWLEANEDRLLEAFLEKRPGLPAVSQWDQATTKLWNEFCDQAYQDRAEESDD